jgi:hypothetical protein
MGRDVRRRRQPQAPPLRGVPAYRNGQSCGTQPLATYKVSPRGRARLGIRSLTREMLYAGDADRRDNAGEQGPNWQLILLTIFALLVWLDVVLAVAAVS